jgi:acyl-CoA synthetase (AMP-forming)/AMP-acid ligase II
MANYKVPRRVEVVDALPMNAAGKVVKEELRARVGA